MSVQLAKQQHSHPVLHDVGGTLAAPYSCALVMRDGPSLLCVALPPALLSMLLLLAGCSKWSTWHQLCWRGYFSDRDAPRGY